MTDKSSTHQRVTKGGKEGWINKEVWADMVKRSDTNGFHAVANTPPEVEVFRQKNKAEPHVENSVDKPETEDEVDPELTGEVKQRGKPGPKPKG